MVGDSLGKLRGQNIANNGDVLGNEPTGSGRILMYTFADGNFTGGGLRGVFDRGVSPLGDDASGSALALSADGTQLVVGAPAASGGRGQVNLYKFSNSNFQGGRLTGSIGAGLTGVGNLNISPYTNPTDAFGLAVALTPDGRGLAVGAPFSSGRPGTAGGALSGAVFTYRFDDNAFGTPTRGPTIGINYNDAGDVNMFGRSRVFDRFGSAVALSGAGTLIVGAPGHSGFSATAPGSGALFGFGFDATGAPFSNLAQFGVIGAGYFGAGGDNTAIDPQAPLLGIGKALALTANGRGLVYSNASDNFVEQYLLNSARSFSSGFLRTLIQPRSIREGDGFGTSLAYSSDGTRLAIGAAQHDGAGGDATQSGAVYLFTQSNILTSTTLAGIIGRGYGSRDQIDTTGYINDGSLFGTAVALNGDGTRLAVGAALQDTVVNGIATTTGTWLYRFNDGFTNGALVRGISREFGTDGLPTDNGAVRSGDRFGSAVALSADATKLAVGAPGSDGASGTVTDSGSVFLYRFSGSDFRAGVLVGAVGRGYTGSGNINTDGYSVTGDNFGASVAFNIDGTRLAVGAPSAASVTGNASRTGSAYVFTFDNQLQNGVLRSILAANGFSFNTDSRLRSGDQFGSAVALDGAGFRLGVGARFHGGVLNDAPESGGVFLFDLNNNDGTAVLHTSLVRNSGGANDTSGFVRNFDAFGSSLAMSADGLRLVVGTPFSSGATTGTTNTGSVFAYSFADSSLSRATIARIGAGFSGAGDINTTGIVRNGDLFGAAVGLSRDGLSLVVGAPQATGASSSAPASGSVFAFSFPTSLPGGGALISSFGRGYTGAGNVDTTAYVRAGDSFGSALALDGAGSRLVVGAPFNAGFAGNTSNSGAVYFYTGVTPSAGNIGFGSTTQRISAASLADLLGRGTSVTLQASNDISIVQSVLVNGSGGGSLTLQAGRSIIASSGINLTTANGGLTMTANETAANGVIASQRDPGAGVIDLSGATIMAGTGAVNLTMAAGTGAGGEIRLGTMSAGSLTVVNTSTQQAATSLGGVITTTGALTLPDTALFVRTNSVLSSSAGSVTWAGEATRAITGSAGGETISFRQAGVQTRSGVLDTADAARLGLIGGSASRVYGDANPALGGLSLQRGALRGTDSVASLLTAGSLSTAFDAGNVGAATNVGTYTYNLAPSTTFGFARGKSGYFTNLTAARGVLSITPRTLFFVADAVSRIYGDNNPSFLQNGRFSGLVNQDDIDSVVSGSVVVGTHATQASNVGSYAINASGVTIINSNYVFAQAPSNATAFTITPRALTATATAARRIYGDSNPLFSGTFSNLANGDTADSVFSALTWTSPTDGQSNIGRYAINANGTFANANYTLVQAASNATALTISPRALTITGATTDKVYGAIFDPNRSGFTTAGLVNLDRVNAVSATTAASAANANVGNYVVSLSNALGRGLSNYAINYVDGTVRVTPATLTYKANRASRIYGDDNPSFTGSILGFVNGETVGSATSGAASFSTDAHPRSNGGNYAIVGSGLTARNYIFVQDASNATALTITPRALTVTADAKSRIYGDANPALTFATGREVTTFTSLTTGLSVDVSGGLIIGTNGSGSTMFNPATFGPSVSTTTIIDTLLSGDTLAGALALSANARSNIGIYAITQGSLSNANYTIRYVGNSLSVTPRALTVVANSLQRIYGNTNPALTFTTTGLVNGDTVSGALTTAAGISSNVGSYAISQGSVLASANYALTYVGNNLVVTPRALTLTANAASRIYGGSNPIFSFTASGLVNGDVVSGSLATNALAASNVGKYDIIQGGATASPNYTITYVGAALTITPATLTYVAAPVTRPYLIPNPNLTGQVNGFVLNDTLDSATLGQLIFATQAGRQNLPGSYAVTGGGLSAKNGDYVFVQAPQNDSALTITPRVAEAGTGSQLLGNPPLDTFRRTATAKINGVANNDISNIDLLIEDQAEPEPTETISNLCVTTNAKQPNSCDSGQTR